MKLTFELCLFCISGLVHGQQDIQDSLLKEFFATLTGRYARYSHPKYIFINLIHVFLNQSIFGGEVLAMKFQNMTFKTVTNGYQFLTCSRPKSILECSSYEFPLNGPVKDLECTMEFYKQGNEFITDLTNCFRYGVLRVHKVNCTHLVTKEGPPDVTRIYQRWSNYAPEYPWNVTQYPCPT